MEEYDWKDFYESVLWEGFYDLVERISNVDINAALHLRELVACGKITYPYHHLVECFIWEESEQGGEYWYEIYVKIGEK